MPSNPFGALAGLAAAFFWSFSSTAFTLAGRRLGVHALNRTRLLLAVLLVAATHWVLTGSPIPQLPTVSTLGWLGASAVLDLVMGDLLLYMAFVRIGPRIPLLVTATAPMLGATLAWLLLGEQLAARAGVGMALALAGVTWVVLERKATAATDASRIKPRDYAVGVLLAAGSALCQGCHLVAARFALQGQVLPLSAALTRLTVAMAIIWLITIVAGQAGSTVAALRRDRTAALLAGGGVIMGPFAGIWMSMIALQSAQVGVASTLMAMTPVLVLPLARWVFRERLTLQTFAGTLLAMTGVVLLILG